MSQEGLEHFDNEMEVTAIESATMDKVQAKLEQEDTILKFWKPFAVIAIVACLGILIFANLGKTDSSQKLYASHYDSPPFLLNAEERNAESQIPKLSSIKNLYSSKEFSKCLTAIESNDGRVLTQHPDLALYQGICLLEEGKANDASSILSKPLSELDDVRLWYLALAYLSVGEKMESIMALESLIKLTSTYKKSEAKALLDELQSSL